MSPTATDETRWRAWLLALITLSAVLRLACVAALDPYDHFAGGDGPWYVRQAWFISHAALTDPLRTVGPLYPLFLSVFWLPFTHAPDPVRPDLVPPALLTAVRLAQVALGLWTAWLGYRLVRELRGDRRAALIAFAGLGVGPAFVLESFRILTETLFMALVAAAVLLHVRSRRLRTATSAAGSAGLFALSTLTRPVLWPLPVLLSLDLLTRDAWRAGARRAALFVATYLLILLPWHVYLARTTGHLAPEGFEAQLWIGAVGGGTWMGSQRFNEMRSRFAGGDEDYAHEALGLIARDPAGWVLRRARNLAMALVQPHGTADLTGPSGRAILGEWWRGERSSASAVRAAFAPVAALKLSIWSFHVVALTFGLFGVWVWRHRWRELVPLFAVIVYLVAAYGMLTALPRYLFPIQVFLWVFAGVGLVAARDRVSRTDGKG